MRTLSKERGQVPRLLAYADSFRLPKEISHSLIKKMVKIAECSGEEYACMYMKSIKLDFIRMKAGLEPCSVWIQKSGPYKGLMKWSGDHHKRWSKAICLLQAYTNFYATTVTPSQRKKFIDGVTAENVKISPSLKNGMILAGEILLGKRKRHLKNPQPHYSNLPNPEKRAPHPNGKTYPEDEVHLESVNYVLKTHFGDTIRRKYAELWKHVFDGIEIVKADLTKPQYYFHNGQWITKDTSNYGDSVGKIGLIQEAGYKLRAVANPGRIYQSLLKPLGDDLYEILKTLPWDCTHNQSKADHAITSALKDGTEVNSVDLSGATDYFPLDLQVILLKSFYANHDHVDLFFDISRGAWIFENSRIQWTKGQPLGLYPSFAAFALTHGVLLFLLNGFTHSDKFFVLGDDVVILDPELYVRYRSVLAELACPVSESKTLSSNIIAEFAGKVFTTQGKFPQLKWRNPSDDNFLDLVKNIGLSIVPILKSKQQKIVNILSDVPDFLGGLGFNPKGLPLQDRMAKGYEIMKDKQGASYLMDFNRIYQRMVYYSPGKIPTFDQFTIVKSDFDKKSIGLVQQLLPLLVLHYKVLGRNTFDVDENQHHRIECVNNRRTRLDSLSYLLS